MEEGDLCRAVKQGREQDVANYLSTADRSSHSWQTDLDKSLVTAIEHKQPKIMKLLIQAGACLNQTFKGGDFDSTVLINVFHSGEPVLLDTYLKHFQGNLVNQLKSINGCTILHAAIRSENLKLVKRACALMKKNNVKLDTFISKDRYYQEYPLDTAAKVIAENMKIRSATAAGNVNVDSSNELSILKYLLKHGCQVNPRSRPVLTSTPLHYVAQAGCMEAVDMLMRYGANVSARDSAGEYPWVLAGKWEHYDIMTKLLDAVDVNKHLGALYFGQACSSGVLPAVEYLLEKGVDAHCLSQPHCHPLIIAAVAEQINVVEYFLANNMYDVNFQTRGKWCALRFVLQKTRALKRRCQTTSKTIANRLIQAGADVNIRDCAGHTLLMNKDVYNWDYSLAFLLKHGADVNVVAPDGLSALWTAIDLDCDLGLACVYHNKHLFTIYKLLAENIDISISQYRFEGKTPLQLAYHKECPVLCDILLDAGCSLCHITDDLYSDRPIPENMQSIRQRILGMCYVPYSLKDQTRKVILGSLGQGGLADKLPKLRSSQLLPKDLVLYLGRTINFKFGE